MTSVGVSLLGKWMRLRKNYQYKFRYVDWSELKIEGARNLFYENYRL